MKAADSDTCPHCGRNIHYVGSPTHLSAGYVVSGKHPYVLGAALGQGGFGITYIALDMVTNTRVAIKEYFPTFCASRTDGTVSPYPNQEETFLKGRERFLDEARVLKSLSDLQSIVNVLDFFEFNNSAYLVMEFLDGSSLKEHAAKNGKFPAQQFLEQITPLMADLEKMHQRGVIHRDIAPDNIILLPDGQMKLIDFGAARSFVGDRSMTVVVKKGFAPVEQYLSKGSTACTDVYALAATIYYCITGKVPMEAAERQYDGTPLPLPSSLGADITPLQEAALLHALEVHQKARTQSVQAFLNALYQTKSAPAESAKAEKKAEKETETKTSNQTDAKNRQKTNMPSGTTLVRKKKSPAVVAALAALVLFGNFFLFSGKDDVAPDHAASTEASASFQEAPEAPDSSAYEITENVSLNVIAAQYSNHSADWWSDFRADFTSEYPMVNLVVDVVSWNDIYTVVNTRIANGKTPDILNIDVFKDYQSEGLLLPVNTYMSEETYGKFYPQLLKFSSADGAIWAVPDLASARALFYNTQIFDELGLTPPSTWEDLENICKTIRKANPEIIPLGLDMTTDEGHYTFDCFALSNGGGFTDSNDNWNISANENAETVQFLCDLVHQDLTNPDPAVDTRWNLQEQFAAGNIAMMLAPDNLKSYCEGSNASFVPGIAPIPAAGGKESATLTAMDRFMCFDNNHSESELAAIRCFFDFFFEDNRYVEWIATEGFLPATSTGAKLYGETTGDLVWNDILASSTLLPAHKTNWSDAKFGIIDVLQQSLMGVDSRQLLDQLQQDLDN